MNDVLRERLSTLYAAVKLGQLDFVLNAVDDDIEYISYSPIKVSPFLGHRRGKVAMSAVLRGAHLAFDFVSCEPVSMVIESENAAVIVFTRAVNRITGRSIQGVLAHFMRFRDGKIVELREFMDSFRAAEQALGREFV
ncbi:MAG: nuclear transport factor 2 family protein [Xanthobacteraceae bacterium]|jgi:ketosteroid isomerase-like protein